MKDSNLLRFFAARMFASVSFKISIVIGIFITIAQLAQRYTPIEPYYLYPTSLYYAWIGGEWATIAHVLAFQLMPICSCLAFSSSFISDKKSSYLKQLIARKERKKVYLAYYITAFWGGAITGVFPFVFNFAVNAALYPALPPQVSTYIFLPWYTGFLVELFYTMPLLYCIIYMLIIALFSGSMACACISLGASINNKYLVLCIPFLFWLWVYYISFSLGAPEFNPLITLAPQHASNPLITLLYIVIMQLIAIYNLFIKAKKDDVF